MDSICEIIEMLKEGGSPVGERKEQKPNKRLLERLIRKRGLRRTFGVAGGEGHRYTAFFIRSPAESG
jgi:hypothetical protein